MTSGRSGKNENLWRDLAATLVQQVADRVRAANDAAQTHHDPPLPHHREQSHRWEQPPPPQRPAAGSMASLGNELNRLVTNGIRATADSLGDYRQGRERRAAEQERKRLEAPMRAAQKRSRANKAGAIATGVLAVGGLIGTVDSAAAESVPDAVSTGVVTVGLGAGAYALTRRSQKYQRVADLEARRLGAASASAVSIGGASAYSVPLPPQTSVAYDATQRLLAQRKALSELLPEIEQLAPELAPLARESETMLSAYAERIIKLERARAVANGTDALDAPLARALAQYEEGVQAHQKLVEAAATVMAELTGDRIDDTTHQSINAAADRLQGLAEGLRQVRFDMPIDPADTSWAHPTPTPTPPAGESASDRQPRQTRQSWPAPRAGRKQNRQRGRAD